MMKNYRKNKYSNVLRKYKFSLEIWKQVGDLKEDFGDRMKEEIRRLLLKFRVE